MWRCRFLKTAKGIVPGFVSHTPDCKPKKQVTAQESIRAVTCFFDALSAAD